MCFLQIWVLPLSSMSRKGFLMLNLQCTLYVISIMMSQGTIDHNYIHKHPFKSNLQQSKLVITSYSLKVTLTKWHCYEVLGVWELVKYKMTKKIKKVRVTNLISHEPADPPASMGIQWRGSPIIDTPWPSRGTPAELYRFQNGSSPSLNNALCCIAEYGTNSHIMAAASEFRRFSMMVSCPPGWNGARW